MDRIKTTGIVIVSWVIFMEILTTIFYLQNALPDFYGLKGWLYFFIIPVFGLVVFIEWFFVSCIFEMVESGKNGN